GLSRSAIQSLIKQERVYVNGEKVKASYRVNAGDEVYVSVPQPVSFKLQPENLPLPILYQDEDIVIVDKPRGMVVHPAQGNWQGTMVNALLYHVQQLSSVNGELRPGIVHRLDKDTSGLMVVAKNDAAHRHLAHQIREHNMERQYIALVHGVINENLGTIEAPIGRSKADRKKMAVRGDGRQAISHYEVMERFYNYTLVKVQLVTGRTHQIRVHFSYMKHPVVGDFVYGSGKNPFGLKGQALHAAYLGLQHPRTGEYLEFRSTIPDYLQSILTELRKKN
ncbi:MAG TPA: RluA family pseudouridine synthase, partial [Syntrophomonadaceae bacterium]|nr:RluA family pseudouridine synthase [Syntrophomonadaceae bacterium]